MLHQCADLEAMEYLVAKKEKVDAVNEGPEKATRGG
jgi:hypothetical protein